MNFVTLSKHFDRLDFDTYDFGNATWDSKTFKGQLKLADKFVTLYNRPTRKRMLYTAKGVELTATVMRVTANPDDVYMVGTGQSDFHENTKYRQVTGTHLASAPAVVRRLTPAESGGKSIWATNETVITTWADIEMRSVDESQERQIDNFGHYFLIMPRDTPLERQDTVEHNSVVYTVLETYLDAGFLMARVTNLPEERKNFVYSQKLAQVYNIATQRNETTYEVYQCTAKVTPTLSESTAFNDEKEMIRVMFHDRFISFEPKIQDQITFNGFKYEVARVQRNSILSEWYVLATIAGAV